MPWSTHCGRCGQRLPEGVREANHATRLAVLEGLIEEYRAEQARLGMEADPHRYSALEERAIVLKHIVRELRGDPAVSG